MLMLVPVPERIRLSGLLKYIEEGALGSGSGIWRL